MRRILFLAAAIGLGLTQGARAADMSVNAVSPFFLPPVNSTPDWSGPYLGFNGGYGFGSSSVNGAFVGTIAGFDPFGFSTAGNPTGAVFGGQVGYNWQLAGVVFGVEGDFDAATLTATGNVVTGSLAPLPPALVAGAPIGAQASTTMNWLSTIRARLGYTWGPGLVYVTGGGAWANVDVRTTVCDTALFACTATNFTGTQSGWTVGAGAEWMLSPNWFARVEYLYTGLNGRTNAGAITTPGAFLAGSSLNITTSQMTINVIRLGLEYKFDWR
jgi:outer membrane immunogenic protein